MAETDICCGGVAVHGQHGLPESSFMDYLKARDQSSPFTKDFRGQEAKIEHKIKYGWSMDFLERKPVA